MKTAILSKMQYGIYAECVSHQGEVYYNLPYLFVLDGGLDEEMLERICYLVGHHHTFTGVDGLD